MEKGSFTVINGPSRVVIDYACAEGSHERRFHERRHSTKPVPYHQSDNLSRQEFGTSLSLGPIILPFAIERPHLPDPNQEMILFQFQSGECKEPISGLYRLFGSVLGYVVTTETSKAKIDYMPNSGQGMLIILENARHDRTLKPGDR